ncbi:hypothetical protein [Polyangium spumosum]|uniref:WD40 repeat domain-containing protein n=1 Tax=Polyangium spumosum TaxID=889282 RepID=A0A6N7Q5H8_9BACT|nr:hypothetical protein [Polyangium spumosum]MRG97534.1 hypothetical protein [Polyangium spumosum]
MALAPDLSAGTVTTFAGRFEPVALPPRMPTIVDVEGRSERDVWMLASDGHVLRWDGARVTDRGRPRCFTDNCCGTLIDCAKQPALCAEAGLDVCLPFGPACAMEVSWSGIRFTADAVIAVARVETGGMRASVVESRLGKNGRWTCEQGEDDFVRPGSAGRGDPGGPIESSVDGVSFQFEGPAFLVNRYGGHMLLADGRRVPLPEDVHEGYTTSVEFTARAPADLWLWGYDDGRVWRGNGLGWTMMYSGLGSVHRIWFGAPASAWILGAIGEGEEQLLRWDLDKGGGQRFEAPGATFMRGDGRDFWLVGKRALYHGDGVTLRRAEPPLGIEDAWRSPSGELWLAGGDLSVVLKKAQEEGEGDVHKGAVFRVSGGQKP